MIKDLPSRWDAYARLQSELETTTIVNNRSWGVEAALDSILATTQDNGAPAVDPATTIATSERRERHRARLRRKFQSRLEPAVDQPAALEARIELAQIKQQLASSDWQLMILVAMGVDYQTIAMNVGQTPGGLRVRTMRIRQSLAGLAA